MSVVYPKHPYEMQVVELSATQQQHLEQHYAAQKNPSHILTSQIAQNLQLANDDVQEWFEAKRKAQSNLVYNAFTLQKQPIPAKQDSDDVSTSTSNDSNIQNDQVLKKLSVSVVIPPRPKVSVSINETNGDTMSPPDISANSSTGSVTNEVSDLAELNALVPSGTLVSDDGLILAFAKLMNAQESPQNRSILVKFLTRIGSGQVLRNFAASKGLIVVRRWLEDSRKLDIYVSLLIPLLKLLKGLPMDIERIQSSKLGKLIKIISKGNTCNDSDASRSLASDIMNIWLNIGQSTTSKDEKKRTPSATLSDSASIKRARREVPDRLASTSKPPEPSPTFDIFKTLSQPLQKIKKADAPLPKRKNSQDLDTEIETKQRRLSGSGILTDEKSLLHEHPEILASPTAPSYRSKQINHVIDEAMKSTEENAPLKKKKSVRWRLQLEQVRLFEVDEEIIKPHKKMNARDFDRDEMKMVRQHARDEIHEQADWTTPTRFKDQIMFGKFSTEVATQQERERHALSVMYFRDEDIPFSPSEPADESYIATDESHIPIIPCPFSAAHGISQLQNIDLGALKGVNGDTLAAVTSLMNQLNSGGISSQPPSQYSSPNITSKYIVPPIANQPMDKLLATLASQPGIQSLLHNMNTSTLPAANRNIPGSQERYTGPGQYSNRPLSGGESSFPDQSSSVPKYDNDDRHQSGGRYSNQLNDQSNIGLSDQYQPGRDDQEFRGQYDGSTRKDPSQYHSRKGNYPSSTLDDYRSGSPSFPDQGPNDYNRNLGFNNRQQINEGYNNGNFENKQSQRGGYANPRGSGRVGHQPRFKKECAFFGSGMCHKGDSCPFIHNN